MNMRESRMNKSQIKESHLKRRHKSHDASIRVTSHQNDHVTWMSHAASERGVSHENESCHARESSLIRVGHVT